MCRRVECSSCSRPTYAGCGAHVEMVLHDVAPADRCKCREQAQTAKAPAGVADRSWFERFFTK